MGYRAQAQPILLSSAAELSSFGYFQRSSIKEMMVFFSRTLAQQHVAPGQRITVKHEGYLCHVYTAPGGITGVCFADSDYPSRVAFGYLSKLCEDFMQVVGTDVVCCAEDGCMDAKFGIQHQRLIIRFQDPSQADQLTRIMSELEQTKMVLHETIEAALERGQKIDSLIEKSNDLSGSSKMFYKTAKKQNQCCTYM